MNSSEVAAEQRPVIMISPSPFPMTKRRAASQMAVHFLDELSFIESLMPTAGEGVLLDHRHYNGKMMPIRKQLLFSLLDSMAMLKARMDDLQNFKARKSKTYFVAFVSSQCGWSDFDRVSIPVLIQRFKMLKRMGQPTARPQFMAYLRRVQREHPDKGRDIRASVIDPKMSELIERAKTDVEKKVVKKTTMASLLYGLRNSRIHQMRNQGDGVDGFARITDEPVYQGFNNEEDLHLVFPQQFVADLVRVGAASLEHGARELRVDPYSFLPDNSTWELEDWTPNKIWKRARRAKRIR